MKKLPYEIILLLMIVALSLFVRWRLAGVPLERDEGEYAYAGQLMLQGIPPYKLAYNMKLPGTYAAYAVIMAVFGESAQGIHRGVILVNGLTILLVYVLGKRIFGKVCGTAAAAWFALLSLSEAVLGLAAHATHFVTLFVALGALCLWSNLERPRYSTLLSSGFFFGMAYLMKQQAAFFIAFGGLVVLWNALQSDGPTWRRAVTQCAVYAVAAVLPFAVACASLFAAGVFSKFWLWTVLYARQYATITSPGLGWLNFKIALSYFRTSVPSLCLLAAFGFIIVLRDEAKPRKLFSLGFLLAAFATACPGLYFREHYFIPLLVPAALLAGAGVQWLVTRIEESRRPKVWLIIPWMILAVAVSDTLWRNRSLYFRLDPTAASRRIYGENPFAEAVVVAQYIREHSKPDALVAVVGSEPEIYFYTGHHSATGYIYTYPLMEPHSYAAQMQREMINEIESHRPEFVVYVDVRKSWLPRPTSDRGILDWFQQYSTRQLKVVGLIELLPNAASTYRWDEKAVAVRPASPDYIQVFRRRDSL